ncbi:MAG: ribbon-helix-helix protein, CopG family [Ilumatobacteraceae bacterium]
MIRTQISMTDEQAEGLRRLAELRCRSQAALMRDALDVLIGDSDRSRRIARARLAVGAFHSGSADTSVEHDGALADAFSA